MERKKEWECAGNSLTHGCDYLDGDPYYPIKELIAQLSESEELGATHVCFMGDISDNELWNIDISPMKLKIESDEEYEARLRKIAAEELIAKERKEAEERAEYERLKAKFEK